MSTIKTNNVQIGQSVTATNNFTWYQPASPDGTVRLGNGNSGAVTNLLTIDGTGNLTFANSVSLTAASTKTLTLNGGGGTNGLVLDASNNVGIGTGTPESNGSPYTTLSINNATSGGVLSFLKNGVRQGLIFNTGTGGLIIEADTPGGVNSIIQFNTVGSNERARIDSSGNLLVGCTSINPLGSTRLVLSENSGTTKWAVGPIDSAVNNFYVYAATGGGVFLSGTSATSWSSNSDERLKTDLKPIENAAQKVSTLRAVTGRYKTDVEGFSRAFLIAQDVQKVLPEAVGYTKLVGADDETDYLALAYTDTIPLLVAAIKELSAEIETLKAKVN